jgi:hypothetical protein
MKRRILIVGMGSATSSVTRIFAQTSHVEVLSANDTSIRNPSVFEGSRLHENLAKEFSKRTKAKNPLVKQDVREHYMKMMGKKTFRKAY